MARANNPLIKELIYSPEYNSVTHAIAFNAARIVPMASNNLYFGMSLLSFYMVAPPSFDPGS